jgi:hypothetical protein
MEIEYCITVEIKDPATPCSLGRTALEMRIPDEAKDKLGPPTTSRQAGKMKA